jgi:hypothetical protein
VAVKRGLIYEISDLGYLDKIKIGLKNNLIETLIGIEDRSFEYLSRISGFKFMRKYLHRSKILF